MGKKKAKKSSKEDPEGTEGQKKEPQMTIREAILAYQINIKETQIGEFMYEKEGLEEKNIKNKQRNNSLKESQLFHIKTLLKQAKERDQEVEAAAEVNKEQVEAALKEKWKVAKEQDSEIQELEKQIKEKDAELEKIRSELEKWKLYQSEGQHKQATHIKLLEEELVDIENNFDEMRTHLEKTLGIAKDEIQRSTDERLSEQKYVASEKAMTTLDKWTAQEVKDNDWLKKEAESHRLQYKNLMTAVERLEHDNLEIMGKLFDCRIEDLKISRNFFLTQFQDRENLDETGILEVDLANFQLGKKSTARPKSATQRAVEDKVFGLSVCRGQGSSEDDSDEDDSENNFENYLEYEDEDFRDYLKLGPVELKLLQVVGEAKPVHPPRKLTDEEQEAQLAAPDVWPVTPDMLKDVARKENQT